MSSLAIGDIERIYRRHDIDTVSMRWYPPKLGGYWAATAWQLGRVIRVEGDTPLLAIGELLATLECQPGKEVDDPS